MPVDNYVVKDVASGIEEVAVLCRADLQCADVVGSNRVEKTLGIWACDFESPHMGAVEHARLLANRRMFFANRRVPQGHQIAGEIGDMGFIGEF